jgi:hypothetical protein
MELLGSLIGRLRMSGLRGIGRNHGARIEQSGQSVREVSAKAALPEAIARSRSAGGGRPSNLMGAHRLGEPGLSEDLRLFDAGIMSELMRTTEHSAHIGLVLREGLRQRGLRGEFAELDDRSFALFFPYEGLIRVNTQFLTQNRFGVWRTRSAAASVVHEGVHYLGLGEIAANTAAAQYLIASSSRLRNWPKNKTIQPGDFPFLHSDHIALINEFRKVRGEGIGSSQKLGEHEAAEAYINWIDQKGYDFARNQGDYRLAVRLEGGTIKEFGTREWARNHPLPQTGNVVLDAVLAP